MEEGYWRGQRVREEWATRNGEKDEVDGKWGVSGDGREMARSGIGEEWVTGKWEKGEVEG